MTENSIHIRLQYVEALRAKKDILSFQMGLLRIMKNIQAYKTSRSAELNAKAELSKKIKELKTGIGKMQRTLPKPKIPEILNKGQYSTPKTKRKAPIRTGTESIEEQLEEIQRRLGELQTE